MSDERDREKEIFFRALELEPGDERDAYLDEACGDEPDLRRGVDSGLLEAHDEPASILEDDTQGTPHRIG